MQNLQTEPVEHFFNHIRSGKKLVVGNEKECKWCDGFGYLKSMTHDTVVDSLYLLKQTYIENGRVDVCSRCNGIGIEPKD